MRDPLVHVQLLAGDAALLRDFYRRVFGWETTPAEVADSSSSRSGTYHWIEDAATGGVTAGIAEEGRPGGVVLGIAVEDLPTVVAEAERHGGRLLAPPADIEVSGTPSADGRSRVALLTDPEGNRIMVSAPSR